MLLKKNIGQAGKIGEPTIKSPPRKRRGKKDRNHFHLMKKDSGLGPVTVNLKRRKEKNQAKGTEGIADMVVESGILGSM
jgi:hypothetical protein